MAETSRPWDGQVTGDAGEYDSNEWDDVWSVLFNSEYSDNECVIWTTGDPLLVEASGANQVRVTPGAAMVLGKFYQNTGYVALTVPTPPGPANRIDRIILQSDWATQTVRAVVLTGTSSAPALTQNDGTLWENSLAQVEITPLGVMTITDERGFLHFATKVGTANLDTSISGMLVTGGDTHDHTGGAGAPLVYNSFETGTVSRISVRAGSSDTDWTEGLSSSPHDLTSTNVNMQCGATVITGANSLVIYKDITFPVPFSSGTIPIVLATIQTVPASGIAYSVYTYKISNSQFRIYIHQRTLLLFPDISVSWIAFGAE